MTRSRETLAWVAGIFDGEGTLYCRQKPFNVLACVQMTDKDIVQRFAAALGFGNFRRGPLLKSGKYLWAWRVNQHEHVQALIAMIWPWLGIRRREKAMEILGRYRDRFLRCRSDRGEDYYRRNAASFAAGRSNR